MSNSGDNRHSYPLTISSNHSDDVDQQRRLEDKEEKQQAAYRTTNYRRSPPPPNSSMYRRSASSDSGSSGGDPRNPRGRGSPVRGRGSPVPPRGGGPRGGYEPEYYGGPPPPSSRGGRRTPDDPYSRGPPPRSRSPPSSSNGQGPRGGDRAQQPPPRGPSPVTSETLSMAEQDFLAKYGYGPGGNINNPNNDPNNNSMSSLPGAESVGSGYTNQTGYSTTISRPRMPRMGPPGPGPPPPDHMPDRRHYVSSGGQSVTSHLTEDEMELQRTQQSRGAGGHIAPRRRSRSPPGTRGRQEVYADRVYNNEQYGQAYGGRPNSRRNLYDDGNNSYEEEPPRGGPPRGMDDPNPPRRPYLQRVPSQSTISTSGFRSFYSDNYTVRTGGESVSTGYQHYYDGPPPSRGDDYPPHPSDARYGGGGGGGNNSVTSRGRSYGGGGGGYGNGGGGGGSVASNSRGGYYGDRGPPPSTRRGPPPNRDNYGGPRYSQPPPPPQPSRGGPPPPGGQPDRPLLEVAPGLLMHLMGTDETMKAIQRGQITVTSCVVCGMDVHCHSASEYVLCPDCRVVSPVNQLDNAADMAPQQGGLVGLGVKTEMLITMMEAGGQQY